MMEINLANPRGFCAGVDRAIDIVNRAIELFGSPIYVRHEVVHNKYVVEDLRNRGAVFVEELEEVPDGEIVIFSAHGVSKKVQVEAKQRGLRVFDATCPLVTKVHFEVSRYSINGTECILIGHDGHPEVEGTMGQYDSTNGGKIYLIENLDQVDSLEVGNPDKLAYVTQTTLSMDDTANIIDALRKKFPNVIGPKKNDICYATQNRQDAVRKLGEDCTLVFVVGSPNSSNSSRLRELAERRGAAAYLIDNVNEIDRNCLADHERIGVTAGASAPEILVQEVIEELRSMGYGEVLEINGEPENISFSLPKELRVRQIVN